ncbi:MAG: PorP/SprF family type IX secretion system membrane protein [Bacteroidota bacterium]
MKRIVKTALLIAAVFSGSQAMAQLSPMGAMYFQNQYLGNPALAGTEAGLDLSLGIRKQWTNIPGSPAMQAFTGSYGLNEKVGLGLTVYNDKAGLFKRTRTVASYAYHLPISGDSKRLSFGLSLGFMNERIATEDIRGNSGDANVGAYNQRDSYIDGDFGVAYTSDKFNIQAAIPNMKSYLKKDINSDAVDRATFFSALSYKFQLEGGGGFGIEPKMAYRGVKGMDNIVDVGANLSYANSKVNLFGMYHSTNSTTWGIGLNYQNIGFSGMYSTATSALSSYANDNFEVSMKVKLFNKQSRIQTP